MRKITLVLVVVLVPALLMANTVTFQTAPGATNEGQSVSASATITTGAGTVTIDLTNLLTAALVKSVSQNISGLFFTLDSTISSGSVSSSTGTFISVGSGGVVTAATSGAPAPNSIGWALTNAGGIYHLNGLAGSLQGPENTIIGGTAGSFTAYTNANNSIDRNGPHNPFVQGTGHFVLSIAGVTAATNISGLSLVFGTQAASVPEPGSFVFLVCGGLGALSVLRRKLRK